jgi:hypothetical protein
VVAEGYVAFVFGSGEGEVFGVESVGAEVAGEVALELAAGAGSSTVYHVVVPTRLIRVTYWLWLTLMRGCCHVMCPHAASIASDQFSHVVVSPQASHLATQSAYQGLNVVQRTFITAI